VEALEDRRTPSAGVREQFLLELVNRVRENPAAELPLLLNSTDPGVQLALSYFKVNKQVLAQQWSTLKPAPPLAWSDALASGALAHSQKMLQFDQQAHQLPGEADSGTRIASEVPGWSNSGENIFAYATSIFDGYASWAIDWNATPTGIANPPGHRNNLMNPNFQQMGIGVVDGPGTGDGTHVGPLAITGDFVSQFSYTPYLLGVVFKDPSGYYLSGVNSNYMLSQGEGLAGVTLTIKGPGGTFTTTTSAAGGYQIQVPPGDYSVTASGGAFGPAQTRWFTMGSQNVHLDFVSVASPTLTAAPSLTGPAAAKTGTPVTISWTPVSKATGYRIYIDWQSPPLGKPPLLSAQGATWVLNVTGTSYTWPTGMPPGAGTYWIKVYAIDAAGYESPVSNTIVINAPNSNSGQSLPHQLPSAASFFSHSPEQYGNVVTAAYQRYLGRTPAPSEVAGWVGALQSGLSDERLEAAFIGSPEYIARHGGSGAGWVAGMYQDLLGRTPAPSEVAGWVNALNGGLAPAAVAYGFAASPEREAQRITADYQKFLNRTPEPGIVAAWVQAFENGFSNEDVIAGFVGSQEYFQKHGGTDWCWLRAAYQDILDRRPDDSGFGAWMQVLETN
jgi:hypothetical protein